MTGGQREDDASGPNTGNQATIEVVSPAFQNNFRDAVFAGSFSLFTLPANAIDANTLGPGNTVRASLHGARFDTPPGKVFVKIEASEWNRVHILKFPSPEESLLDSVIRPPGGSGFS